MNLKINLHNYKSKSFYEKITICYYTQCSVTSQKLGAIIRPIIFPESGRSREISKLLDDTPSF